VLTRAALDAVAAMSKLMAELIKQNDNMYLLLMRMQPDDEAEDDEN